MANRRLQRNLRPAQYSIETFRCRPVGTFPHPHEPRETMASLLSILGLAIIAVAGCSAPKSTPTTSNYPPAKLSEREISLYRHLIQNMNSPASMEKCFLTLTPMSNWGDHGNWLRVPAAFDDVIPDGFLPADDARLKDGCVLPADSEERSIMHWLTILRWINDTTAEVEEGNWCCPLGGGASKSIYELIDDEWVRVSSGGGWVS